MKKNLITTLVFSALCCSSLQARNFITEISLTSIASATPCTDQWLRDVEVMQEVNGLSFEVASGIADTFFFECLDLYYPY